MSASLFFGASGSTPFMAKIRGDCGLQIAGCRFKRSALFYHSICHFKFKIIMHTKLFIPGPVEVSAKTFAAFCQPMIGHRSGDFKKLYASIHPRLQQLFGTKQPVFLSTSSAWGVME